MVIETNPEGAAEPKPADTPRFETLGAMLEFFKNAPIDVIYFIERIEPQKHEGKVIAGLFCVTSTLIADEAFFFSAFGGGLYVVRALTPEESMGSWAAECFVEVDGDPIVLTTSITLPPGVPMDIIYHPAAKDVLSLLFMSSSDFGTYEDVPLDGPPCEPGPQMPPRAPMHAMPLPHDGQPKSQSRSAIAPGMALGAAMTAYGFAAFADDFMRMLGSVGNGGVGEILRMAMEKGPMSQVPFPMPPAWGAAAPDAPESAPEPPEGKEPGPPSDEGPDATPPEPS